jgi:dTDP-glucose pyrophosphorylase
MQLKPALLMRSNLSYQSWRGIRAYSNPADTMKVRLPLNKKPLLSKLIYGFAAADAGKMIIVYEPGHKSLVKEVYVFNQ